MTSATDPDNGASRTGHTGPSDEAGATGHTGPPDMTGATGNTDPAITAGASVNTGKSNRAGKAPYPTLVTAAPVNSPSTLRLTLIGVLFVSGVIAVASYTHQLIIPLFLGLLTWGKVWLKSLTPKLGLLLMKNGLVIQLRRLLVQASTHVFVKSHRPWRRWLTASKQALITVIRQAFGRFMGLPLWARTTLALLLLLATAGSSLAVFALLVIPQPLLNWLRQKVMGTLNKLGVTQFFAALWRFVVPASIRRRWHIYVKWTLGRRQVIAARRLHESVRRQEPPKD